MIATIELYAFSRHTPLALLRDQLHESFVRDRPEWNVMGRDLVDDDTLVPALISPTDVLHEVAGRFRLPEAPDERKWVAARIMAWWASSDIQYTLGAEPLGEGYRELAGASLGFSAHRQRVMPEFHPPTTACRDPEGYNALPGALSPFLKSPVSASSLIKALYHVGQCSFDSKADAIRFLCLALTANVTTPSRLHPRFEFDTYKLFGNSFDAHQFVLSQFRASPAFALTVALQQLWAEHHYPGFDPLALDGYSDRHYLEGYLGAILRSAGLKQFRMSRYLDWQPSLAA